MERADVAEKVGQRCDVRHQFVSMVMAKLNLKEIPPQQWIPFVEERVVFVKKAIRAHQLKTSRPEMDEKIVVSSQVFKVRPFTADVVISYEKKYTDGISRKEKFKLIDDLFTDALRCVDHHLP